VHHPIELVSDIPVKLRSYEAVSRGQHIVIPGIAWAGGVKKTNRTFGRERQHKDL